jgi:hypothetical protein
MQRKLPVSTFLASSLTSAPADHYTGTPPQLFERRPKAVRALPTSAHEKCMTCHNRLGKALCASAYWLE